MYVFITRRFHSLHIRDFQYIQTEQPLNVSVTQVALLGMMIKTPRLPAIHSVLTNYYKLGADPKKKKKEF